MSDTTQVILDDDPTGTQLVTDVPVLLDVFDRDARHLAFTNSPKAVHVVTNSRAYPPGDVTALLTDTLHALADVAPDAPVLLRGDSTLRAHLAEEYQAVCDVKFAGRHVPLMLLPALPTAGRITIGGTHMLVRDGETVPLTDTEYADDGVFTYTDAHLLRYAEQRTNGLFNAANGVTLTTGELEDGGATLVCDILKRLTQADMPGVFAPDITDETHLKIVSDGLTLARHRDIDTVVRCAPAFAAIHAGTRADTFTAFTPARGVIVMVGSYVPTTTRQLHHLTETAGVTPIIADVTALASGAPTGEQQRLAAAIDHALHTTGLAVVATPRQRPQATVNLNAGETIARNYAATLRHVTGPFDTVIAKGGITSMMTAQVGLDAAHAHVEGPVITGVSQWRITRSTDTIRYLVVPGNVGDDTCLTTLVTQLQADQNG